MRDTPLLRAVEFESHLAFGGGVAACRGVGVELVERVAQHECGGWQEIIATCHAAHLGRSAKNCTVISQHLCRRNRYEIGRNGDAKIGAIRRKGGGGVAAN